MCQIVTNLIYSLCIIRADTENHTDGNKMNPVEWPVAAGMWPFENFQDAS